MSERKLFQNIKFDLVHPRTGRRYQVFMTGTASMNIDEWNRLMGENVTLAEITERGIHITPPIPFEEASAYEEFQSIVEDLAEGIQEMK